MQDLGTTIIRSWTPVYPPPTPAYDDADLVGDLDVTPAEAKHCLDVIWAAHDSFMRHGPEAGVEDVARTLGVEASALTEVFRTDASIRAAYQRWSYSCITECIQQAIEDVRQYGKIDKSLWSHGLDTIVHRFHSYPNDFCQFAASEDVNPDLLPLTCEHMQEFLEVGVASGALKAADVEAAALRCVRVLWRPIHHAGWTPRPSVAPAKTAKTRISRQRQAAAMRARELEWHRAFKLFLDEVAGVMRVRTVRTGASKRK